MEVWREAREEFHGHMAGLLVRLGRYDAAATALKQSPSAAGYYRLACALQQESRHQEALAAFEETARLLRSLPADYFYCYGLSLEALRRFEDAADAYRTAALMNPADAEAWGGLGAMLAVTGRWKDAAHCQERAMRLAPSVENAVRCASTLHELGRLETAERVLREALAIEPHAFEAKEVLAAILARQTCHDEATALAWEACEQSRGALSSRIVLAGVLSEAGRLDDALGIARAAAKIAPCDARVYGALGAIHLKRENGTAALMAFERMAECLEPDDDLLPSSAWIPCMVGRGMALSLLGHHEEALASFDDVLVVDPEFLDRWPEIEPHYRHSSQGERPGR